MVPAPEDTLQGLDGNVYRVHWVCGYMPRRHGFLVRCAQFALASGRRVDARVYALIQHSLDDRGHTEWKEIEL